MRLISSSMEAIWMNGRVLVAYASKYGGTAEIAEALATAMRDRG